MPWIKGIPGNSRLCQALMVWICLTGSENVPGSFQMLLRFSRIPETCGALAVVKAPTWVLQRVQKKSFSFSRSTQPTPAPLGASYGRMIKSGTRSLWSGVTLSFQPLVLLLPPLHVPCVPASSVLTAPRLPPPVQARLPSYAHASPFPGASSLPVEILLVFFLIRKALYALDEILK